MTNYNISGW